MNINEDISEKILNVLATAPRGYEFAAELGNLMDKQYMTVDVDITKQIECLNAKYDNLLSECLNYFGIPRDDGNKLAELSKSVVEHIKSLEPVEVTVFFTPDMSFIKKLRLWFSQNLNIKTLLKIRVNPDILGGLEISYKGRYLDLSLKKQMETYFKAHKADVLSRL